MPVVFLMGATATGKTQLAVEIAREFPVEIISVDSALIYRGMNIGTAKPDSTLLSEVPHHLIDIRDPAERYSVSEFLSDTESLIEQIRARGAIPLLAGGTMMYFHTLEKGLNNLPEASPEIRKVISHRAEFQGWSALHNELATLDPVSASLIKPSDGQRIQRALEVFQISGKPMSALSEEIPVPVVSSPLKLILGCDDRSIIHQRIESRFDQMLFDGFIDEVRHLKSRNDLNEDLPSIRCVGYRQVWEYLDGLHSPAEMRYRAIVATRQLAKRQLTWLRKYSSAYHVNCLNYRKSAIFQVIDDAISQVGT
ncbi:MAG: tRNA dimethylallyltransferase [Gammaproteobacteria bacterium]|jgi:tRNA dimethylallyltransferase